MEKPTLKPMLTEEQRTQMTAIERAIALRVEGERRRIIDVVIDCAWEQGWCNEVLFALEKAFGTNGSPWSDGVWRDSLGYDIFQLDWEGYGKDGFDRCGRDREGYNRDGYNRIGFDRQGKPRRPGLVYGWSSFL